MGKGSAPRPLSVDRDAFESEWDRIFGKKEPLGISSIGRAAVSNIAEPSSACAGSSPASPAIYINPETGE